MARRKLRRRVDRRREEHVWLKVYRADAASAQDGRCCYCQEPLRLSMPTADHRKPRSEGGQTSRENIAAACGACNSLKGSMSVVAFKRLIRAKPALDASIARHMAHYRVCLWRRTWRAVRRIERLVAKE